MSDPYAALDAAGLLPDPEIDLAETALQLARTDQPWADWHPAREHLSELARDAVALAKTGDLQRRAAQLAALLAGQHGYHGDVANYDDLANANLIQVIARRRGLPIALGLLWLHCARAAGWAAHGVDFPGHFLICLDGSGGQQLVIDPFNGGAPLDADGLRHLLQRFEGPQAELRPGLLRPMRSREVLLRLQNNIRRRQMDADRPEDALGTLQTMLRIAPDAATLWRDAAELHESLDHVSAALRCYTRFLDLVPDGAVATQARQTMDRLRTRLN